MLYEKVKIKDRTQLYKSLDYKNLHKLKKSREQVETDVGSLRSRIGLLELEERRALKLIEDTKAKAV